MITLPTLDPRAIEGLRDLSPDASFLAELIEIYLQDTPVRLAELDAAWSASNAGAVTRAAHTIKGSSSNFGALRLSELAQTVESYGKAANLAAAATGIRELKAEYERVAAALSQILRGGSAEQPPQ